MASYGEPSLPLRIVVVGSQFALIHDVWSMTCPPRSAASRAVIGRAHRCVGVRRCCGTPHGPRRGVLREPALAGIGASAQRRAPLRGGDRAISTELPIDKITRPLRRVTGGRCPFRFAANNTPKTKFTHQTFHGAAGNPDTFTVQLCPNLRRPIHTKVLAVCPPNLNLQRFITDRPTRSGPAFG